VAGELGHRRAGALFAVLAQCRLPVVAIEGDPAQSRMDVGVRAGPHREADVAVAGVPHEIGATGRVGAHLHGPSDDAGVVTDAVAERDLFGQLRDGGVEDGDVIGDAVGSGVSGRQLHGKRLAGGIREAVHRVEPVAALVVRRRIDLVLRMDLVQRAVDVENHRRRARGGRCPAPHRGPHLACGGPQPAENLGIDRPERPVQRRVRRHRAAQPGLGAEVLDVGTGLATAGEHEHRLDQHLAPVMGRRPLTRDRDGRRE